MSNFVRALEFTLRWEGGYSNHSEDPGGETNFGISKRAYPNEDIRGMTYERAGFLYRRDYWDKLHCDEWGPRVSLVMFDWGVHSGPVLVTKRAQSLVNVSDDGKIGPITINAIQDADDRDLAWEILLQRVRFLVSLQKQVFLRGWMTRTHDLARQIG